MSSYKFVEDEEIRVGLEAYDCDNNEYTIEAELAVKEECWDRYFICKNSNDEYIIKSEYDFSKFGHYEYGE
jgi:hypothetical protein